MAQLRRRTEQWWECGRKRAILLGAVEDPRDHPEENWADGWIDRINDPSFEEAKPGDVWIVRWDPTHPNTQAYGDQYDDWPITGYGLWCPNERCHSGMHLWTHASDCEARYGNDRPCKTGEKPIRSCWTWSGSIEGGDLTAQPSLFVNHESCGWHGFLTQGEMRSV